jgi:alpha-D-xyloside xylohydrolase
MPRTRVTAVESHRRVDDRTVRLDCATVPEEPRLTERGPVVVSLAFLTPRTFRFELQVNPEAEAVREREHPDYHEAAVRTDVDLDVREADDHLRIATEALVVEVGTDEWSFRVRDPSRDRGGDGTVYAAQTDDVDVRGDPRVDPLWFAEEEVNHGPRKVTETGTAFALAPDERLYGLGETFTGLDKTGGSYESWHVEPLGTETERAYKNVPFHLSSAGYGLLVDTTRRVRYDLGAGSAASGQVAVDGDRAAFVFCYGPDFRDVLSTYTALTGRPRRPPKWSFGVWMSRLGYESREQLESITDRLRAESIPCDVVHLDPFWMRERQSTDLVWDTDQFPAPAEMIDRLHERGFHLSLWEHPHVPVGTDAFREAAREGYFVEDGTGKPYVMDRTCQGDYRGAIVDFTDPDAVAWWQAKHRRLLEMGVDTFKTDYGEYVPEDAVFANGRSGTAEHNLYPYRYNEAVYRAVEDYRGPEDTLLWSRAAWTGSQRYPVHWGGDPQTSFVGMAAALKGGLSASLSGFGYWSHDIGGFRGEPSTEVYVRWAQFGLLSSHARCHGTTPREPWAFGEEALDVFRRYARLRYRLLPYLYSVADETARTGLPTVRPLVFAYQDDPSVADLDDQFLLGPNLLVAPVFAGDTVRSVYLPEGEWVDWWTDERYRGGRRVEVAAPLDRLPLFVRAGGVVPMREATETVQPGTPAEVDLRAVLPSSTDATDGAPRRSTFEFYDEDRDAVVDLRVVARPGVDAHEAGGDHGDDGPVVEVRVGETALERVGATVDGVGTDPAAVHVNGAPAEWTYDAEADRLSVAPSPVT